MNPSEYAILIAYITTLNNMFTHHPKKHTHLDTFNVVLSRLNKLQTYLVNFHLAIYQSPLYYGITIVRFCKRIYATQNQFIHKNKKRNTNKIRQNTQISAKHLTETLNTHLHVKHSVPRMRSNTKHLCTRLWLNCFALMAKNINLQ